jgi:hypothetical protein
MDHHHNSLGTDRSLGTGTVKTSLGTDRSLGTGTVKTSLGTGTVKTSMDLDLGVSGTVKTSMGTVKTSMGTVKTSMATAVTAAEVNQEVRSDVISPECRRCQCPIESWPNANRSNNVFSENVWLEVALAGLPKNK